MSIIATIDAITWISVAGLMHIFISLPTALHVLHYKDNERAVVIWLGLIMFSPFLGSTIYWLFGINRVKRNAQRILPHDDKADLRLKMTPELKQEFPAKWRAEMTLGYTVHLGEYTGANKITPLSNGDQAYPEMLRAIANAKHSVFLSSYIFIYDEAGRQFVESLITAHRRGVIVRVLLDGIGVDYGWHKADRALNKNGVKTARFLPTISLFTTRFINLRNHRKILCVDNEIAFLGGMNISAGNLLQCSPAHPVQDVHFKIEGPVVDQVSKVFADDWFFATKEVLQLMARQGNGDGSITSRVLPSGPDGNYEKLRWILIGAVNNAQKNIRILTPYFIPGIVLITLLQAAALRGVTIEIIVPEKNNIPFFNWAMQANLSKLLMYGIKFYTSPQPFEHSKIFLIDDSISIIGSSNWDSRSLDLNFEVNLECYDKDLNQQLLKIFENKKSAAKLVLESEILKFSLFKKIRNNLARLLSPYL